MNEAQTKMMAIAGAVLAVGVVSFLTGRWSAPEPPPRVVIQGEGGGVGPAQRTLVDAPPPSSGSGSLAGHDDHDGHDHGAHTNSPSGVTPTLPKPGTPVDFQRVFDAAKKAFEAPDDHHTNEAALAAAGELELRLLTDPVALDAALERFPQLVDQAELEILAAVLGRVRDPEVEDLALRLAQDRTNPLRSAAALDILDSLDTPKAREVALNVLQQAVDVNVRRAALRAVPEPQGASQDEARGVVQSLIDILANDPDSELRRRAAVMLGTWHRSQADLQPVINHLISDPSVDVRAGAAFGLELSRSRDPAVIDALTRTLVNTGEDPLVRENAWKALGAISPLPPAAHQAYRTYAEEREALGEAGGG